MTHDHPARNGTNPSPPSGTNSPSRNDWKRKPSRTGVLGLESSLNFSPCRQRDTRSSHARIRKPGRNLRGDQSRDSTERSIPFPCGSPRGRFVDERAFATVYQRHHRHGGAWSCRQLTLPRRHLMIPVLFEIGPLKVYSYGLMLGIGFLLGSYILSLELRRRSSIPTWPAPSPCWG